MSLNFSAADCRSDQGLFMYDPQLGINIMIVTGYIHCHNIKQDMVYCGVFHTMASKSYHKQNTDGNIVHTITGYM